MPAPSLPQSLEICIEEAATLLRSGAGWRLVDCREEDEFCICRLDGAALLPLSRWGQFFPDAFPARTECILSYCHHGRRSLALARFLQDRGYPNVRSIRGGIDAWSCLIDRKVPRY